MCIESNILYGVSKHNVNVSLDHLWQCTILYLFMCMFFVWLGCFTPEVIKFHKKCVCFCKVELC